MIYGMCQRSTLWFLPFNIHTSRHEHTRVAQLCGTMFSGAQFAKGKVPLCEEPTAWTQEVWDTDFAPIWRRKSGKKIPSVWQIQKRIWLRHDGILTVSHLCANLLMFHPKMSKKKKKKSKLGSCDKTKPSVWLSWKAQTNSGCASVWRVVEITEERLECRQPRISYRMVSSDFL